VPGCKLVAFASADAALTKAWVLARDALVCQFRADIGDGGPTWDDHSDRAFTVAGEVLRCWC